MIYAKIKGTGSYLPEKVLTNQDLEEMVDTSDEWIVERTGIRTRHIAAEHESCSSMAEQAARNALEAADIDPADLDLILVATATPDKVFPSSACLLQKRLGIAGCPAFDLSAACSGFVYALDVADKYIRSGAAKNVLIVGSEILSRYVDWKDRTTCVLFGDGAGAVVLQASTEPGILASHMASDGQYEELLYANNPFGGAEGLRDDNFIRMKGNEVFKVAVKTLSALVDETLRKTELTADDIDWLVPHQANIRIIQAAAKKLKLPMERVVVTVETQGNTSSASIPLALDKAVRSGQIKPGQNLLLEAFGGGFVWGGVLIRY
ncbi:MAG: 3-oxoacyl-ACP synthase [Kangiellaceae bacterium]|nr:3-oxoacyl-ACP synthase [Kangiellaceae bacterium]